MGVGQFEVTVLLSTSARPWTTGARRVRCRRVSGARQALRQCRVGRHAAATAILSRELSFPRGAADAYATEREAIALGGGVGQRTPLDQGMARILLLSSR